MATLVMKFGGSLTADARKLSRVAGVIAAEALAWDHLVVVVSAMGGVTDALRRAVELAETGNASGLRRVVAVVREKHVSMINTLFDEPGTRKQLTTALDNVLYGVLAACDEVSSARASLPRQRDAAMAAGEQIMATILTALLRQEGLRAVRVEAESLILTDDTHQNAIPMLDMIEPRVDVALRPVLAARLLPVVPGFIGVTRKGVITTLGRGGSDYTATLLAAALRADEVWLWTSVDGIMSADPAWVPGARVIPALTYEEVEELAYFGTRLLHPDAIEPLIPRGIPLRVRSPYNLDHAGTLIHVEEPETSPALKAVAAAEGVYLALSGSPLDLGGFIGQVQRLAGHLAQGPVITLQTQRRAVLVYVVPTSEGPGAAARLVSLLENALARWEVRPCKVIAAFGAADLPALTLDVPVLASGLGLPSRRLYAVNPGDAKDAVRQLHRLNDLAGPERAPIFPPPMRRAASTEPGPGI